MRKSCVDKIVVAYNLAVVGGMEAKSNPKTVDSIECVGKVE
jgi:hypothetical protein